MLILNRRGWRFAGCSTDRQVPARADLGYRRSRRTPASDAGWSAPAHTHWSVPSASRTPWPARAARCRSQSPGVCAGPQTNRVECQTDRAECQPDRPSVRQTEPSVRQIGRVLDRQSRVSDKQHRSTTVKCWEGDAMVWNGFVYGGITKSQDNTKSTRTWR